MGSDGYASEYSIYSEEYGSDYSYDTDEMWHMITHGTSNGDEEERTLELALEKLNLGPTKKLLVLSLNGLLIHRAHRLNDSEIAKSYTPDFIYNNGNRFVYKRPFLEEFMNFCLERFEVGIWSSAQENNIDDVLDRVLKGLRSKLLFVWDQDQCSDYGFKSLEKKEKPLFFKELSKLWSHLGNSSRGGSFSDTNTLLVDDKPYKGLLNPPNTGIYPETYDVEDESDKCLDIKEELCLYLKGLADAEDVPSYVKDHTFGQPAVETGHPDWEFYSGVLCRVKD